MKNERITVIAGMVCLFVLIISVVVVTVRYMHAEPWWNREPTPIVTEAPYSARLDEPGQNRPPGDGVALEQDEHAERSNL